MRFIYIYMVYIDLYDLVGGIPTPLKNMKVTWIMTFPIYILYIYGKRKHIPNHQPGYVSTIFPTIVSGDIPGKKGLIYGRYLQFRYLWPLINGFWILIYGYTLR